VRLSPIGTSVTNWRLVPASDDRWWWMWSSLWNEDWQGKPKYSEKICPSTTLSTTNPTWLDLRSNPGRRGGKPATNHLNYGEKVGLTYNQPWHQQKKNSRKIQHWADFINFFLYCRPFCKTYDEWRAADIESASRGSSLLPWMEFRHCNIMRNN
jgi:hypothetical protein